MKKGLNKIFLRSLKQTRARFISIFCIVFLGSAFFAGLRNSPITMQTSMDTYFKENHFAPLTFISTLGFNEEDVEFVRDLEETGEVSGSYRSDFSLVFKNETKTYHVIGHSKNDYFNQYEIIKGRDIENSQEILLDEVFASEKMIGKTITIENDYGTKDLKVVGIVNSPMYCVAHIRGSNTYTNQSNNGFIIMHEDAIKDMIFPDELYDLLNESHLYNELLVDYKNTNLPSYFDDQYDIVTKKDKVSIEDAINDRLSSRRKTLVSDLEEQLVEPKKQYEDALKQYEEGKLLFEQEISKGKMELVNAKLQVLEHQLLLTEAMSSNDMNVSIDTSNITKSLKQLQDELNDRSIPIISEEGILESLAHVNSEEIPTKEEVDQKLEQLSLPYLESEDVYEIFRNVPSTSTKQEILDALNGLYDVSTQRLNESLNSMSGIISELYTYLGQFENLSSSLTQFVEGYTQIEKANILVDQNQAKLNYLEASKQKELDEAKVQLDDAKKQLDDASKQIKDFPGVAIYTLTHNENAGIVSYTSDSNAIGAIANVFPIVFFLVAALVSLTTMTRMVEEQRLQGGILKALGYDQKDILMYYVKYVLLATSFATIIGIIVGTYSLSSIIFFLYQNLMYEVNAKIHYIFELPTTLLTIFISVGMILLITLYVAYNETKDNAATLMRPKAPKVGKRIFLENIDMIWKRLTFNQKVTVRNMFRYKKRFFMSIIGIAGCSALLVVSAGLNQSVSKMLPLQFEKLWHYDGSISLKEPLEDIKEIKEYVENNKNIYETLGTFSTNSLCESSTKSLNSNVVVFEKRDTNLISFYDEDDNSLLLEDTGVFISKKTAEMLGVKDEDHINITIQDQVVSVKIEKVIQNHLNDYIYMSKGYYESLCDKSLEYNNIYFNLKDNDETLYDVIKESLMKNENIKTVEFVTNMQAVFDDVIRGLNSVVLLIICAAAALAFVVLYNLTNINIQERKSEIATIKVLGFYPNEVYDYVFKENILLALIGSFAGLFLGKFLHYFIISLVEPSGIMFMRSLSIISYILAIIMTLVFTYFINIIMRKVIKDVHMVESLKSVE